MTVIERHLKLKTELIGKIIEFRQDIKENNIPIIEREPNKLAETNIVERSTTNLIIEIEINHEKLMEVVCQSIQSLNQLSLFPEK